MKPNPEWEADVKVEAVRITALALSTAWEQFRDARREGRAFASELALTRALADDLVALTSAAATEIGKATCSSKTSG